MTPRRGAARIGILGGSFNPVHNGHLLLAEQVREALRLDRVLLLPAAAPPHKAAAGLAPAADRLAMLRLAIRGIPGLAVSDLELRRGGLSYTVETLEALRRRMPRARFFFIVGQDWADGVPRWFRACELPRLCTLVIVPRPPVPGAAPAPWPPRILRGFPMRPVLTTPVGISASAVRRRAARGLALRHLVPPAVASYLRRKRLYSRP